MKLLFFGIHPDDIELGCGGTVIRCVDQGHNVVLVDMTRGESSSNGTQEERAAEATEAAAIMGCDTRDNLGLPDTGVVAEDPEQLRVVADALRLHRPDVVLMPNGDDPHPDHASGAALIERALYVAGIQGFKTASRSESWKVRHCLVYSGRREVRAEIVVDTTAAYERKLRAIEAHRTQFGRDGDSVTPTPINAPGFLALIEARDRTVGAEIGVAYGEAFRALGPVGIADLGVLFGGVR